MTLFHMHHGRPHGLAGANRVPFARLIKRTGAALRKIHRAIAAAKIHRLRRELMLHSHWTRPHGHEDHPKRDIAKIPQPPLVLGEKWDY